MTRALHINHPDVSPNTVRRLTEDHVDKPTADRPPLPATAPAAPGGETFEQGWNCWQTAVADRVGVLVHGADYFAALEDALRSARRSILIVGWDFDPRIRLRLDVPEEESPPLGRLLRQLVEERPELEVRVLVWSSAVAHGPSGPAELLIGTEWQQHPRISLRLDTTHPLYAAHHQKIVTIDGALAFTGGIDLTLDRWDTEEHRHGDPRRRSTGGSLYGPIHDVQIAFDGEAARALSEHACWRWKKGTGETPDCAPSPVPWPETARVHFTDTALAIARTVPDWGDGRSAHEAARLTEDMLWAAERTIYIEAQYFAATFVGDVLERRLSEPDGPEVIAIVSLASHGFIERQVMGRNRDRMIRRLRRADRHGRFRIYNPVVPGGDKDCSVLIHSKLIISDDRLLRIGSSNLNNRSVGLDTELDVALEARDEADRAAVASLRNHLLAEHLGVPGAAVEAALAETGSLVRTIERLNTGARGLRSFDAIRTRGSTKPVPGTSLLDPARPFEPPWLLRRRDRRITRRRDA